MKNIVETARKKVNVEKEVAVEKVEDAADPKNEASEKEVSVEKAEEEVDHEKVENEVETADEKVVEEKLVAVEKVEDADDPEKEVATKVVSVEKAEEEFDPENHEPVAASTETAKHLPTTQMTRSYLSSVYHYYSSKYTKERTRKLVLRQSKETTER